MPAVADHYQPYLGLDANDFRKPVPAWPASELILGPVEFLFQLVTGGGGVRRGLFVGWLPFIITLTRPHEFL